MTQAQDLTCNVCGAEFLSEELLRNHSSTAHEQRDGENTCVFCGARFESINELAEHVKQHADEAIPCPECGVVLPEGAALEEHLAQEHPVRTGLGRGPTKLPP